jgi:hypothetical protein
MTVKLKEKLGSLDPTHFKKFYEDEYAVISFIESVPCIKIKITGVPHSSEHFQFVQRKIVEAVILEKDNYCRLHMLTDSSNAGIVLNEDMDFYKGEILPQIEKAGIRYHAIVLPESNLVRNFINGISLSTKKIIVEYFNTASGASKWLRHR